VYLDGESFDCRKPDMREILVRVIELMGFTAFTSKNGTGGVEKAVVEKPNLILMDIMMPEISGWEATQMLRGPS
jgi:CheY-like chemotaxis protein